MIRLALTGSIGMGKSTTAGLFAEEGIPVNDADEVVHRLYRGRAVKPVEALFPGVVKDGAVDRQALSEELRRDPSRFAALEAIVHPLVGAEELAFLAEEEKRGSWLVLLDIPLLYETGAEKRVDYVLVVTCDPEVQRARVLARPNMTREKFEMILARQVPDAEKRRRADFVIDTGHGLEAARAAVRDVIAALRTKAG